MPAIVTPSPTTLVQTVPASPGVVPPTQVTVTGGGFPWWIAVVLVLAMAALLAFERYRSRGLDEE